MHKLFPRNIIKSENFFKNIKKWHILLDLAY